MREKTNKIYRSGIVHTDTAEQILDIFRTHLLNHPPRYFGDIDSIAEFLYFQYTETNLVENETVRKSYTAFMDELTEASGCRRYFEYIITTSEQMSSDYLPDVADFLFNYARCLHDQDEDEKAKHFVETMSVEFLEFLTDCYRVVYY